MTNTHMNPTNHRYCQEPEVYPMPFSKGDPYTFEGKTGFFGDVVFRATKDGEFRLHKKTDTKIVLS